MIDPDRIFGRLGNKMFQGAFLSAMAKKMKTDRYFQDPKWFEKAEEEVKYLYRLGIVPVNKVAIHVRRGDYVNHPLYVDLTKTGYYTKALKEFEGYDFLIFSDDIPWAKKYFSSLKNKTYCEVENPVAALNLMAGCLGIIMANSTFSWWAAYLSEGTRVIAPSQWFSDGTRIKYDKSWTII